MDAASAAKDRVDRALALLERRLLDLKSRAADAIRDSLSDTEAR